MLNQTTNVNANLNFGWRTNTHGFVTERAVNSVNGILKKNNLFQRPSKTRVSLNADQIRIGSRLPDTMHKDFPHISDVNHLEKNDAFSRFCQFNRRVFSCFNKGDQEGFQENLGKALHYVQDLQNPYHACQLGSKQTRKVALGHLHFEDNSAKMQNRVIQREAKRYKTPRLENDNFKEYLKTNMQLAKIQKKKLNSKQFREEDVLEDSLQNTYQATFEYLMYVLNKLQGK